MKPTRTASFAALAGLSALLLAAPTPAVADCELTKLLPSDGAAGEEFGTAASIFGYSALVGVPLDDDQGVSSGSAYIFRYDGTSWVEAKLLPSDGADEQMFGWAVAMGADIALVGAYGDQAHGELSGAAYAFHFDGANWVEKKIVPAVGHGEDFFGYSVSISEETALIGAYGDDYACPSDPNCNVGAAYIFEFDGQEWIERQKLMASDAELEDWFGYQVAISGDVALIGAYQDDDLGDKAGSAYIFRYNGSDWVEEQKLLASDGAANDRFSRALAVSGDVAVVGAPGDDVGGSNTGSAYVYRYNGSQWVQERKLRASDATTQDRYGRSVAVSGDTILIGVPNDDDGAANAGSVYVYHYDGSTWDYTGKLLASDAALSDKFGNPVSASGDLVLAGAAQNDDNGSNSGSAYVFLVVSCPGDLDGDNDVDLADLTTLLSHYGTGSGATYEEGDLDCDGDVDLVDLSTLLGVYGTTCD